MHIQQPQYHKHGQTAGEDTGTAYEIQQDIPEGMVRRATAEATRMATDNATAGELPGDTRRQH